MWRKTFQKEPGFTGYVQRWSFGLGTVNWLLKRESKQRVSAEAYTDQPIWHLMHKIRFCHGGEYELLTEKSYKDLVRFLLGVCEGKEAKVLIQGVDEEGFFLDDCCILIVEVK